MSGTPGVADKPRKWWTPTFRLTVFGRSLLLVCAEVITNAVCWAVAGILFAGKHRSALGLAMLAWVSAAVFS